MARPRKFTPQEARRRDAASKRRSHLKHKADRNRRRAARRSRSRADEMKQRAALGDFTLSTVSAQELRRPRLLWLDQHGHLRLEEELSAEELMRRYEATRKIRQKEHGDLFHTVSKKH